MVRVGISVGGLMLWLCLRLESLLVLWFGLVRAGYGCGYGCGWLVVWLVGWFLPSSHAGVLLRVGSSTVRAKGSTCGQGKDG